ncbi:MAG: SDR family oxidoreductase [Phycisphaeraceae bacterium]|nr:SDR family oxidoreductase [Phycisphaeraceae bacterium]
MSARAVIVGASRRVGRSIALAMARRGFDLILTARSDLGGLQETAAMVSAVRGQSAGVSCERLNLSDPDEVEAAGRRWQGESLDVLILNASMYERSGVALASDSGCASDEHDGSNAQSKQSLGRRLADSALKHFEVNAASALALSTLLAPALARSSQPGGGAITALGDMHVMGRPVRGFAPYLMSKAALAQMVHSLAVELAPRIRVNLVHPGVVAWPEETTDDIRRAYEAKIPLGRSGTPDDAAEAVAWLSVDAMYVTGAELRVDGGRWLR